LPSIDEGSGRERPDGNIPLVVFAIKTPPAILMADRQGHIFSENKDSLMAQSQLSVRSAKARDLAHRRARREQRSIADIVERALEAYEIHE
jgi:hypothetical protein